jgi:hypothetical protein
MAALATAGFAGSVSLAAFGGEAANADTTFGSCTVCSAPPPPPTFVPTTSTAPDPTSAPPPDTQPPARPKHLSAVTNVPGAITLRWVRPAAFDLAGIVVRRGRGDACPASPRGGVQIGGTAPRATQTDTGEADTHTYCYAVFAYDLSGNYSTAAVARHIRNPGDVTPPPPVAELAATLTPAHHVALRWVTPARAGVRAVVVRRGAGDACPTGPETGAAVGGRAPRTGWVDALAKPGSAYCYGVYAIDAAGNPSAAAIATITIPAATPPGPQPDPPPGRSSGAWLTSTLVWTVTAAGLVMLLLATAAGLTARRRPASAYAPGRTAGTRMALAGYSPVALVIPALVVVAFAAVAIFLLNP